MKEKEAGENSNTGVMSVVKRHAEFISASQTLKKQIPKQVRNDDHTFKGGHNISCIE